MLGLTNLAPGAEANISFHASTLRNPEDRFTNAFAPHFGHILHIETSVLYMIKQLHHPTAVCFSLEERAVHRFKVHLSLYACL